MEISILEDLGERFLLDAEFISNLIKSLKIPKGSKILDVGTGWGKMSIILALHGHDIITREPEKWSEWESSAKKAGVYEKITYQQMDAQQLAFPDNSIEFIFLLGSLHHIPNKDIAFKGFLRVLSTDGRIVLFDYTNKRIEKIKKQVHHHPHAVNPEEILDKLPVIYQKSIDEKKEIFSYIIKKN